MIWSNTPPVFPCTVGRVSAAKSRTTVFVFLTVVLVCGRGGLRVVLLVTLLIAQFLSCREIYKMPTGVMLFVRVDRIAFAQPL